MPLFRALLFLMLVGGLLCAAMYIGTGDLKWRRYGVRLLKWAVIAAFGFFAVLMLERLAVIL